MDLHQLRVFQAAVKNGGFTRAGEALHLSQSTVSQHISQLEHELGCALFLRVGKRVVVSEAGNLLLQYTEKIFRDLKNAEMAVRELSALKRGTVRLGVGPTTLTYRLPQVLADYKRRFPEIELIVLSGNTYIRPHKHLAKSESFHVIEGLVDIVILDDQGAITEVIQLGDFQSSIAQVVQSVVCCGEVIKTIHWNPANGLSETDSIPRAL